MKKKLKKALAFSITSIPHEIYSLKYRTSYNIELQQVRNTEAKRGWVIVINIAFVIEYEFDFFSSQEFHRVLQTLVLVKYLGTQCEEFESQCWLLRWYTPLRKEHGGSKKMMVVELEDAENGEKGIEQGICT